MASCRSAAPCGDAAAIGGGQLERSAIHSLHMLYRRCSVKTSVRAQEAATGLHVSSFIARVQHHCGSCIAVATVAQAISEKAIAAAVIMTNQ